MIKKFVFACAIFNIMSFSCIAENTSTQEKKLEYVKGLIDFIFDVLVTKATKEQKIAKIRGMVEKEMDFDWNAKVALGANAKKLTPEEMQKFTSLYKEIICQDWASKFTIAEMAKKSDIHFKERVVKKSPDTDAVSFVLEYRNGNKANIDILVKTVDDSESKFKVIDLIGEGVSIALSYRSQFSSYIDEHGVQSVIPHLEKILKDNHKHKESDAKEKK